MSTFPPRYLRLSIGAPARLKALRTASPAAPMTARAWTLRNYESAYAAMGQGRQADGSPVWTTHTGPYFRHERDAGTILDDAGACYGELQGYWTDTRQDGFARGIVASLPHGRFLAGYEWTDNGERVWFGGTFTDECDAAKRADEHARVFSKSALEDSINYDRARDLEDSIETNLQRLRECIALRHRACMAYVRLEARTLIEHIREERARLAHDYSEYC